jgi:L-alanine-DL-glutamate epimerase-like enolase superfamily enzyme
MATRKILRRGVTTIKIKVGKDLEEDEARVRAVFRAGPKARLFIDANQGYRPLEALKLLRRLRSAGIHPVLFEQPVAKDDLDGLEEVGRKGGVPVAADESAASLKDVWNLARRKAASVINIKFMKFGVWEAWAAARAARAAGLGLMMGGMVESRLAMGCGAHFAAGFGGFEFIDLDTPLWFAKDPMRGPLRIGPGGIYDLARVDAGIGVKPI